MHKEWFKFLDRPGGMKFHFALDKNKGGRERGDSDSKQIAEGLGGRGDIGSLPIKKNLHLKCLFGKTVIKGTVSRV